jgi:hypothetical protein
LAPQETVWTARLAAWSLPAAHGAGYCAPSHPLTGGNCGPRLDAACTATWAPNAYNLKLKADGGVCARGADLVGVDPSLDAAQSYCPVLDLDQAAYARCLGAMAANASTLYAVVSPGVAVADDGHTVGARGGGRGSEPLPPFFVCLFLMVLLLASRAHQVLS